MPYDPCSTVPEAPAPQSLASRDLTAFAPVPRLKDRSNGWKPEVQRAFIEALADTGSVRAAASIVGRSVNSAYQLRRHPEGAEFAAAWETAQGHGIHRLEDTLMERALNGVEAPVYSYGSLIGTRTVYNDRLGMFMLRSRLPDRYCPGGGARGLNAVNKMELTRLKKQWREEWERELLEQEAADADDIDLPQQFQRMHRNWYAALSPRARAAYRTFRRFEREDKANGYAPLPDEVAEAEAEYPETYPLEGRSMVDLMIEADGYGVDAVLAEDTPA